MKLRKSLIAGWLTALALATPMAFVSQEAAAQPQPLPPQSVVQGNAAITGFDVAQLRRLVPGEELVFTLYGTPGARVNIHIDGVDGRFALSETEPGVYQGAYTIRSRDRLAPNAAVTANLRVRNEVATVVLDEPLLAGAPWQRGPGERVPTGLAPKIERFTLDQGSRIEPGYDMAFTLHGTPGGSASARIAGVPGKVFLNETAPGTYQGSYTVRQRDRLPPNAAVTASLRVGNRESTAALRDLAPAPVAVVNPQSPPPPQPMGRGRCLNCGVVEAINVIEVKGKGGYVGLIAGGLAGAVLGNQVGSGSGRTAAQILGAAGGAYAGREIEKNVKKDRHYEVVTRLEGGGTQTITYDNEPGFKVGDRVKVENNLLVAL